MKVESLHNNWAYLHISRQHQGQLMIWNANRDKVVMLGQPPFYNSFNMSPIFCQVNKCEIET